MKYHLRGQTQGQSDTKDWIIETFPDRVEVRFGKTGRGMQNRRIPKGKCRGNDVEAEAQARIKAKFDEGYWQISGETSPDDAGRPEAPASEGGAPETINLSIVNGQRIAPDDIAGMVDILHREELIGSPTMSWDEIDETFSTYLPSLSDTGGKLFRWPIGEKSHGRGGYGALLKDPEIVLLFAALVNSYSRSCSLVRDESDDVLDKLEIDELVRSVVGKDEKLEAAAVALGLIRPPMRKAAVKSMNEVWFY
jgi:hypothetical protein